MQTRTRFANLPLLFGITSASSASICDAWCHCAAALTTLRVSISVPARGSCLCPLRWSSRSGWTVQAVPPLLPPPLRPEAAAAAAVCCCAVAPEASSQAASRRLSPKQVSSCAVGAATWTLAWKLPWTGLAAIPCHGLAPAVALNISAVFTPAVRDLRGSSRRRRWSQQTRTPSALASIWCRAVHLQLPATRRPVRPNMATPLTQQPTSAATRSPRPAAARPSRRGCWQWRPVTARRGRP
mmetsp:Transcript_12200/g.36613  ORF Transcript_12200/g.36613 Transcript_12200/m.36613 type:complete len:240 (-) Transcript_12200:1490-2209(-)